MIRILLLIVETSFHHHEDQPVFSIEEFGKVFSLLFHQPLQIIVA